MKYASNTSVSSDRSRAEIEKTLSRYGASKFMYGWEESRAVIGFQMKDRMVKFILPMPSKADPEICKTDRGKDRSPTAIESAFEQAQRQRWRALNLVVKAKLEAVETGITTFEEEFLAHMVLPNGKTVSEELVPQLAIAYETKKMPKLLPGLN